MSLLGSLPAGSRVGIERMYPDRAKGWCSTIDVPPGAGIEFMVEAIRGDWGGGKFRLRPLNRNGNFVAGGVTISIAGEPLVQGKRVLADGTLEQSAPSQWGPPPPWYQPQRPPMPAPGSGPMPLDNPSVVAALSGLVGSLVGDRNATTATLDARVGELRAALEASRPQPVDGFGELRKSMELMKLMRETFGAVEGGGAAAPSEDMGDMMGMGMPTKMPKTMEEMIPYAFWFWMMKQQSQPQWVQNPQTGQMVLAPPQQGMMPPGMMPPGMMPPGMMPPGMMPPGMAPPQWPQAAPPQSPWPQQAAPPPAQPQPARPVQPNMGGEAVTAEVVDEPGEFLSADDVLEELNAMDPAEAARFFVAIGDRLPAAVQAHLMSHPAVQANVVRLQGGAPPQAPAAPAPAAPWLQAYDDPRGAGGAKT